MTRNWIIMSKFRKSTEILVLSKDLIYVRTTENQENTIVISSEIQLYDMDIPDFDFGSNINYQGNITSHMYIIFNKDAAN